MERPKYYHGCPICTFLGGFEHGSWTFDLYFCNGQAVARFGDEPEEFDGFRVDAILRWGPRFRDDFPAVAEAYRRAIEKVLV